MDLSYYSTLSKDNDSVCIVMIDGDLCAHMLIKRDTLSTHKDIGNFAAEILLKKINKKRNENT